MAVIELNDVSFVYRGSKTLALKNITLSIEPGEFVGIIGPTGAGKSTLCWAIVGVVPQILSGKLTGTVTVKGLPANSTPVAKIAQIVGLVQQDAEAQLLMTDIEKEIAFPLENLSLPRRRSSGASTTSSIWSTCAPIACAILSTYPVVKNSAWPWRPLWRWSRKYSSWMKPLPSSTRWEQKKCTTWLVP